MRPRRSPTCHGDETCVATLSWSFKIDIVRVLLDLLNVCLILICIKNHKLLAFRKSIYVLFFRFCSFSGIILDRIHKNFKLFPIYDFRLTIFQSFGELILDYLRVVYRSYIEKLICDLPVRVPDQSSHNKTKQKLYSST